MLKRAPDFLFLVLTQAMGRLAAVHMRQGDLLSTAHHPLDMGHLVRGFPAPTRPPAACQVHIPHRMEALHPRDTGARPRDMRPTPRPTAQCLPAMASLLLVRLTYQILLFPTRACQSEIKAHTAAQAMCERISVCWCIHCTPMLDAHTHKPARLVPKP